MNWQRLQRALPWLLAAFGLGLGSVGCKTEAPPASVPAPPEAPVDQSFRFERPGPLEPLVIEHPEPRLMQLGNGLGIWLIERPTATLSLRLSCRVGSRDNPRGKAGLTALTNRLLTEGTSTKSALQLAVAVEDLGASLAEASGRDASSIGLEVLPQHEERAIALMAEVLMDPAFRSEDFERVRSEWLDDLALQRQDPTQLSWLVGYRALLGPELGLGSQGTPRSVSTLTVDDVRKNYQKNWVPDRCALLAAGPTTTGSLEAAAADAFGSWSPGRSRFEQPMASVSPPGRTRLYVYDRPGSVQTAVFVGGLAPKRYAEGHEARQVVNNLFGGLFTSRLNLNLREQRGYTYGAFSSLVTTLDWGIWALSTSVRTDVTPHALKEIQNELTRLVDPHTITQDELERARTDLIFGVSANLSHTERIVGELDELFVYELPTDHFVQYAEKVNTVANAEVAAQLKHVPAQGAVVVIVGDQRQFTQYGLLDEHTQSVGLRWLDGG